MNKSRLERWDAGITLLLTIAFSLVFFTCNTPLGPAIGSDNAIYLTMGTALAEGFAPYTQVFDHKGPLLFLLQWLPQALGGGYSMTAVFLQEALFLFASLLVLRRIEQVLGAPRFSGRLCYLAVSCSALCGGNLTEEYSGLFTLLGLYELLCAFGQGEVRLPGLARRAGIAGACAMAAFMTRANNVLPLAAAVLVMALSLLLTRQIPALWRCAGGFLSGCALVAVPIVIWLASRGALEEAVYGSIIHNMMYAQTGSAGRVHTLLFTGYGHLAMVMAGLSCAGALGLVWRRGSVALPAAMLAAAAAGVLAAFISRKFYDHYLLLGAPLGAMGLCALLGCLGKVHRRRAMTALCVVSALWLGTQGMATNTQRLQDTSGLAQFTQDAKTLMAQIPQEEQDSLMAYRVEPKWYVAADALPSMRFYFLQEILAWADPAVMDEIVQTFETQPPKWLVLFYNRPFEPPYDERVQRIFDEAYEFAASAGEYQLLKLVQ